MESRQSDEQASGVHHDAAPVTWAEVVSALTRQYRVTASMVFLVCLVPFYLVVASFAREGSPLRLDTSLDAVFPLVPAWALIYGALYLFLIVLPVLVVQDEALIRATVRTYLAVWLTAYACFWLWPTVAPRPAELPSGTSFAEWGLRFLYRADPPFNCFPSLHVAHTFVSALAVRRVHARLGAAAVACACLVAVSTLFTKQHYAVDAIAGAAMALAASRVFLRGFPVDGETVEHRRVAPGLAAVAGAIVAAVFVVYVALYIGGVELTDTWKGT